MQGPVTAPARDQAGVPAALRDAPVLEHDDQIGAPDGRQPVSDNHRGAPSQQLRKRLEDQRFGLGVEAGRRLVEQQDRRVLEQRAGDRDALPLPAGEGHAALADRRSRSPSGSAVMKSWMRAARAAASISASVASGLP